MEEVKNLLHPIGKNFKRNFPVIKRMGELLKNQNYKDPVLICTGSSGLIISTVISQLYLDFCPIVFIKEQYNHSHDNLNILSSHENLIVVDDFIVTGETIFFIINKLKEYGVDKIKALLVETFLSFNRKKQIEELNFFNRLLILNET